jgi:glucose/arabinose dehydrogenase/cytochrome c2
VAIGTASGLKAWTDASVISPDDARWPTTLPTTAQLAPTNRAYVVDNVALPLDNPWKRNVRLADLAFFKDGRAAAVTFDGDVWMISGLGGDLQSVTWKRFTSGLHEPLCIAVRNAELFVCDRNGIWRLRDTDQNGEADVHELFSNAFAQTAETREFATGMRVAPDGAFILSKGGQQSSTIGIHNGTVLRVAPDGKTSSVLGWGLRMPFIGVHPVTGLVTASDQQGHYVPTTPLHIIRDRQYYGYLATILPKEKYPAPITDALTWIPHPVNPSAASQVWLTGAKLGPLTDALINIGYYQPELLLVLLNQREPETQAAVVSLTRDLEFAPLNGAVNPVDGQLYVTGFQIWGTEAKQISGLARVRYTGAPSTLPREVTPMDQGVLLRFDVPLDAATATNTANFSAERWSYKRTANYGSPHFKLDGTPGRDTIIPASAYLSKDARSVFLGLPDMQRVMQMRVGWTLPTQAGVASEHNAYFTIHALSRFDPEREGFVPLTVDLTPKPGPLAAATPVTVEEGHRLATLMACVSCHSTDGTTIGKVGPTWKGLFGREVQFANGGKTVADELYLRESITEPNARIVRGFDKSDTGMPSYQGVINDAQVEALILYIKSLK